MFEITDMAQVDFWRDAMDEYAESVRQARREWAGRVLQAYPDKERLSRIASDVRQDLEAMAVEVNAIASAKQTTVAKAPPLDSLGKAQVIPVENSLCVLSVGLNRAVQISDIKNDPFTEGHHVRDLGLASWASCPIEIDGLPAGTVCALEVESPRTWTEDEEERLYAASSEISDLVERWLQTLDNRSRI